MNYGRRGIKKRQKAMNSPTTKVGKFFGVSLFAIVTFAAVTVAVAGMCAGVGLFMGVVDTAPDISNVDVAPAGYSTTVYDSEGNQVTKLVAENSNRVYVKLDKIPLDMQHAFVAIEDERFYTHNGIDIKGIMRAGVKALSGNLHQGASTITQQLLKNNVFTSWTEESSLVDKFKRKFQEQYCAIQLEKRMSKDQILENYLNTINLGQGTLGVQAASQRYFGKNVSDLNLSESAVIACITQNPSKWNPISHPEKNAERREEVLKKMKNQGYINEVQFNEAMADDVYSRIQVVNEKVEKKTIYTYFVDELTEQVLNDLQENLGYSYTQAYNSLYSGGLSIFTTQDPHIQSICDEQFANEENYPPNTRYYLKYEASYTDSENDAVNFSTQYFEKHFKEKRGNGFNCIFNTEEEAYEAIEEFKQDVEEPGYKFITESISLTPQPQASVTIIDQYTGEVKAIVGGRGEKKASLTLNRATDTKRQPGSCFKVLAAYAPALDAAGKSLASTQVDEPYSYANGRPVKNWYSGYKGICTYRYGIEQSLNIVAVKTITEITPQLGFDYLLNFGFTTLVDRRTESNGTVSSDITQALALGGLTDGVTNLELTAAFATIANGGTYIKPMFYTKIIDHDGNVLIENTPKSRRVLKETTAFLLTDAMEDVVTQGTGARVKFDNMAIAGKTGTTTSNVDVWFSGYTPYYTCCTWSGYDNNVHMNGSGETNTAKTLWKAVMSRIHEGLEYKSFTMPEGITTATVCKKTGGLVTDICRADGSAITEYFATGTVPTEPCTNHYGDLFDTGLVCAMTGQKATATCPYAYEGEPTAEGFCPHSTINGVAAQDYYNLLQMQATAGLVPGADGTTTIDPNAAALDPNAAAAAQAQQDWLNALNALNAQNALNAGQ
ncbi:MAG: PBP1A family penicillin-binding protein [Lachnospiraceae bacterium]|jgi:penicillin-binding protein 1A|nr:PBP1A family penicillin-binding protein [Lachnospiraceae bacterium]